MPKRRSMRIQFPLGGLNRERAHRQQPPFTTRDCSNVRPIGMIEQRERGGSRPGLVKSHADDIGTEVRLLSPMVLALGDGFTNWSDTFAGTSMASAWTLPSWSSNLPNILPGGLASIDTSVDDAAAVADVIPNLNTSSAYTVEMYLAPWSGAWAGVYTLYLRLDNVTPDILGDGVEVVLTMTGTDGSYSAVLNSVSGTIVTVTDTASGTLSSTKAGWLSVTVSNTNDVSVFWGEAEIMSGTVDAMSGARAGFGLDCTVAGSVCMVNVFRVQYFSTILNQGLRSMLIASASGNLWKEATFGRMTQISTSLTLLDDTVLTAAQSGQILVIADYGELSYSGTDAAVAGTALTATAAPDWTALTTPPDPEDMVAVVADPQGSAVAGNYTIASVAGDTVTLDSSAGTGACSIRIERAPKVYDPSDDSFIILTASDGIAPIGCPLTVRYLDRLVLAGAEIAPHVYYMSRKGGYLDYDFSQTDSQRAVAGGTGDAGVPGEGITALVTHSDDFLIFGCRNQIWRMRGDPAFGGDMDAVSYKIGIVGPKAWCIGPSGELIFMSLNGLHALAAGGAGYPFSLSEDPLPLEFKNIDPNMSTVSLEYDVVDRGVHIYLTPESSNARTHWWFDWKNKTIWPMSYASGHEPTCTCSMQATAIEESGVILGGRDGYLRRHSHLSEADDGTNFSSYVVIGPISIAPDSQLGSVNSISIVMAESSGDVTWNTYPAITEEATYSVASSDTGTWVAGINGTTYPSARGQAYGLKLTGEAGRRWALEGMTSIVHSAGKRRIP